MQELIQAVEQADSPGNLIAAVRALAAAKIEAGIPTLIAVLGYNNPGAATAAVEGLIQMGEMSVQPILELLDGYNYGARAYAIRALSAIGDPRALECLIQAAANDFAPSVRRSAAKGLGSLRWNQLPAEQIADKQAKAVHTLKQVCHDPDWSIRYAAVAGLQALAMSGNQQPILAAFEQMLQTEAEVAVRARVLLAHQQLKCEV